MFANTRAFSGFAVDDVQAAQQFYGEVLGITTSERNGLMTLHLAGGRDTLVYPKPGHVPAAYTILNFPVDSIDAAVDELSARGVTFERYDGLAQDEKGISRGYGPDIAWFRDPAGNILAVLQESRRLAALQGGCHGIPGRDPATADGAPLRHGPPGPPGRGGRARRMSAGPGFSWR